MKYLQLLLLTIILNSCSSSKLPFEKLEDIDAKIINNKTNNRFFIPNETYEPLYVRANFIYLLDENGEGNFNGKIKEDNQIIKSIYKGINKLYANLKDPKDPNCYKGTDFIKDTKIQFKFRSLYVKDTFARSYRNAKGFNENKRSYAIFSPSKNWYLKYLDDNINDTISKKGINAFFNMDKKAYDDIVIRNSEEGYNNLLSVSVSQFPSYSDFTRSSQICFPNKYTKRLWMEKIYSVNNKISWQKKVKGWFISSYKGISHELGHSLSLAHSNEHHGRNKCKHAMMNQGHKYQNNYIPPSEIGKMHKALMTTNLIQFVTEKSNYNKPRIIFENQNWDFKTIRFYQDIIVEEGKILILNGSITLPPDASITLEKDAILVLNNTELKSANGNKFNNIIKKKNAKIIKY